MSPSERPPARASGSRCELCGSVLMNAADGWPTANAEGCTGEYHDGGYGSTTAPGYCGVQRKQWLRR